MTKPKQSVPHSSNNAQLSAKIARQLLPHAQERQQFWSEVIAHFEQDLDYARGQYRRASEDIAIYREILSPTLRVSQDIAEGHGNFSMRVVRHAKLLCQRGRDDYEFLSEDSEYTYWRDVHGTQWRACGTCSRLQLHRVEDDRE